MHDGRVEPGAHALGQEHRVEHGARGRLEAEGHVGDAQRRLHVRVTPLELGDRLDRLDRVPPGLLLPGGDREGQAVHDDVRLAHAPGAGQVLDEPGRDGHLPVRRAGLPLLVDGERDDRRPVLTDQRHDAGDAGSGLVAVLVVDRVDDGAPAEQFQAGLDHRRLGGIQHQRQGGRGGEAPGDLPHVRHAVPAHVVHAQVQQVGAVASLGPRDLHALVVPAGRHRLAERLRPVGVGPFPDGQERGVLPERHVRVQRGDARLGAGTPAGRRPAADPLGHRRDVLRGGAAAAAHQRQAELTGEPLVRVGELGRRQRVAGPVRGQLGQPGVRHAGQRDAGVRRQVAQMLAHLPRPGRAVEPDDVHPERLEGGQRGPDLAAEQHRPGRLDRHVRDQHDVGRGRGDRPPGPDDRGLGLQQVLAGFHDERVGPAAEQAGRVFLVGVAERREPDVPQRGQLCARPHGTQHPARAAGLRGRRRGRPGEPGARFGQLADPVRDAVFTEIGEIGTERIRRDAVRAGRQVRVMNVADNVRAGNVQDLVTALVPLKIVQDRVAGLQHRAHGPIGHQYPAGQRRPQAASPIWFHCIRPRPAHRDKSTDPRHGTINGNTGAAGRGG